MGKIRYHRSVRFSVNIMQSSERSPGSLLGVMTIYKQKVPKPIVHWKIAYNIVS